MARLAASCAIAGAACASESDATHPGASGGAARAGESVERVERCAPSAPDGAAVRVQTDLAYALAGGDTLRLDLATPPGRGPHPVVVLLHGGGWEGGDRRAMHDLLGLLAARGYAAATVGYRLTAAPRNVFPAAVQDVRCAVRWLRGRADGFDLDPDRVGVLGFSAGAHLASMLGVAAHVGALDAAPSSRDGAACLGDAGASPAVQAVVSVAGPQDLRVNGPYTAEQARLVTNFLGVFPGDAPDVAALASPILHVSERAAPFLLVHGTRDDLVPVEHARRMRDALRSAGVPASLLELREAGHGFPALHGPDDPVGCTTFAFLDRWLRPR